MRFFSKQSGSKMRRWSVLRFVCVALVLGAAMGVLAGCSDSTDPIDVGGTWALETPDTGFGPFYERWTISDNAVQYETSSDGSTYTTTYRADIVDYVNGSLNAGDTALTSGRAATSNPGFAVIQYTEVNGASTGEVGKFNVFRWADNTSESTNRDFTQGFRDADGSSPFINEVFDSAAAAETGATNGAGYFAGSSNGAVRQ